MPPGYFSLYCYFGHLCITVNVIYVLTQQICEPLAHTASVGHAGSIIFSFVCSGGELGHAVRTHRFALNLKAIAHVIHALKHA